MNTIWNKITAWFASKGGFAHVCAALFLLGYGAYFQVPAWRDLCDGVYNNTPVWVHAVILAGLGLYAWYKRTSSPKGALENVERDQAKAVAKGNDGPH